MSALFRNLRNNLGQGLVEIIAAIAIGTVLILALVALSVRANRSADFAKAESQAAKLASEGIEIINSVRKGGLPTVLLQNSNCTGTSSGGDITWDQFFVNDIIETGAGCHPEYGRPAHFHRPGVTGVADPNCDGPSDTWCFNVDYDGSGDEERDPNNTVPGIQVGTRIYNRNAYIADTHPNFGGVSKCNSPTDSSDFDQIKQFTIVVRWTDVSGVHSSITSTCIQR